MTKGKPERVTNEPEVERYWKPAPAERTIRPALAPVSTAEPDREPVPAGR